MIYISGQQISSLQACSQRFQQILSMIDDGAEWFNWAMTAVNIPDITAASEDELLYSIQYGLHADDIIRFTAFRAGIKAIMAMSDDDIAQLATNRKTPGDGPAIQVLLSRYDIATYSAMDTAIQFVKSASASAPNFYLMPTIAELQLLSGFMQQASETIKNNAASAFALSLCNTLSDFTYLLRFYDAAVSKGVSADQVTTAYHIVLGVVPPLLFTISISSQLGDEQIVAGIRTALQHQNIGYRTMNAAVADIASHITDPLAGETDIANEAGAYIGAVVQTIIGGTASSSRVSQDGGTRFISFENEHMNANIGIDTYGTVYIVSATPKTTAN